MKVLRRFSRLTKEILTDIQHAMNPSKKDRLTQKLVEIVDTIKEFIK